MALWVGVVRVSFVGTRAGDRFHADEEQVEDIERAVAGMPGARLHLLPPELDVSGGLPLEQRPSLLAAVEGVERGEYAGIIVSYLSRLGRSVREQLRAWDRVEAAGGRIIVVREGIDTTTPHGRMQRTILLAIAEAEREQHVERFDTRRRLATAAGIWQRRQTPRGYARDPATRRLVPDEHAALVQATFRGRANGTAISTLAQPLGMTTSGVRALLRNRVYLGELRVGQYVNPEAHEPLVDPDLFDAVTALRRVRPPRRVDDGPALLAGLVRCRACGHVMTRGGSHARGKMASVYACPAGHSGGRCPAPAAVTCRLLDDHVEAIARAELRRLRVTAATRRGEVDGLRERLAAAELELATYVEAVSAADVGAEAFGAGARARRQAVDEARDGLRRAIALAPADPGIDDGEDAWERLNGHGRNVLLRSLLEAVIVRPAGRGKRVPIGDRVRVIAHGHGLQVPVKRAEAPMGILALPWLDLDAEGVLGPQVA